MPVKVHHQMQEGLTTTRVPEFNSSVELPLSRVRHRNVGGNLKEVKDTLTAVWMQTVPSWDSLSF